MVEHDGHVGQLFESPYYDDGDFESLMAELMDEFNASLVGLHPFVFYDFVDQVILAVPEAIQRFGLRRGVARF
jgi:hypothetical protein